MSRRPPYVYGSHHDAIARSSRDGWWTLGAALVAGGLGGALVVAAARWLL